MPDGGGDFVWPQVPAHARRLSDAIGAEGLLRLIEARGGTSLRLGETGKRSRSIAGELGLSAAQVRALRKAFGEERIKVPLLREWCARIYRRQGLSYSEIALKLRITDSQVWFYLRQANMTGAGASSSTQLSLDV